MRWFRSIWTIALLNLRKWKSDYRVWIAFAITAVLAHSTTRGLSDFCSYVNLKSSPWIYPFLYMKYYTKMLFFFPLILIFSNAPFIDGNQLYTVLRTGKRRWCAGQILYIVITSAIFFGFVFLMSILFNLDCMELTGGWGKVLNTLANTDAATQFQIEFTTEKNVLEMFTPFQAVWFTYLHSCVSGVILGLLIFAFNMRIRGSGIFASAFLLVFCAIAAKESTFLKMAPITWSTLNYIQLKYHDGLPEYGYVSTAYTVILILEVLIILLLLKRYNFDASSSALKR